MTILIYPIVYFVRSSVNVNSNEYVDGKWDVPTLVGPNDSVPTTIGLSPGRLVDAPFVLRETQGRTWDPHGLLPRPD